MYSDYSFRYRCPTTDHDLLVFGYWHREWKFPVLTVCIIICELQVFAAFAPSHHVMNKAQCSCLCPLNSQRAPRILQHLSEICLTILASCLSTQIVHISRYAVIGPPSLRDMVS